MEDFLSVVLHVSSGLGNQHAQVMHPRVSINAFLKGQTIWEIIKNKNYIFLFYYCDLFSLGKIFVQLPLNEFYFSLADRYEWTNFTTKTKADSLRCLWKFILVGFLKGISPNVVYKTLLKVIICFQKIVLFIIIQFLIIQWWWYVC